MFTTKKLINDNFVPDMSQLSPVSATELSGFVPRSIQIRRLEAQGELNKIMTDYEIGKLQGSEEDLKIPVPILNIKGLDRDETIQLVRNRSVEYNDVYQKELSAYEKKQLDLQAAVDFYYKHKDSIKDSKEERSEAE